MARLVKKTQRAALDAAPTLSAANPVATIADLALAGILPGDLAALEASAALANTAVQPGDLAALIGRVEALETAVAAL